MSWQTEPMKHTLPQMNCGGTPIFDSSSGISYRCDVCFAVIGSIGQPQSCVEINKKDYHDK